MMNEVPNDTQSFKTHNKFKLHMLIILYNRHSHLHYKLYLNYFIINIVYLPRSEEHHKVRGICISFRKRIFRKGYDILTMVIFGE